MDEIETEEYINPNLDVTKSGIGIGLCGAHRTGKTTLAKHFSQFNPQIPFIETSVGSVASKKYGVDLNSKEDEKEFLNIQEFLIDELDKIWQSHNYMFITDRTPIDIAAYTIIKTRYSQLFTDDSAQVERILNKCKKSLNKNFGLVIQVNLGISYVEEHGKPPTNKIYQQIHNDICLGWGISNFRNIELMPKSLIHHTDRIDYIVPLINDFSASMIHDIPKSKN